MERLKITKQYGRDETLDSTRGICVLAMAVHHCINYFPGYSLSYWRFVSGAFVFLAGYLITSVLTRRKVAVPGSNYMGWRLFSRGLKLIALCLVLNAALIFLLPMESKGKSSSVVELVGNVALYGNFKTVTFSLLVPIGYTIALGGLLILLHMMRLKVVLILSFALFCYCVITEEFIGLKGYYLSFLSVGVFGMAAGYASDWIVRKISNTIWYAIGPWIVMQALVTAIGKGESYPIYCLNTMASLLLIIFVVQLGIKWRVHMRLLALLGRYSLLVYLVQIATLYILRIIFRKLAFGGELTGFWFALLFVNFAQVFIAVGTDLLRKQSPVSDRVYGWVFR